MNAGWRNRITGHGEVAPDELLANPRNWRIHGKTQQAALSGVLDDVGWVQQILVNQRTGHVVDGHLRVTLALRRNEPTVPVTYVDLTEQEEALILATLDPISALAGSDEAMLNGLLRDVSANDKELVTFLASLSSEKPVIVEDEVPEPPVEPITKPGDLWLLGEHRLLCGDSTKPHDMARVMGNDDKATLVLTDPPYNVDFDYGDGTDDDRPMAEYMRWNREWFAAARARTYSCVVLTCGIINLPYWLADVERTHRILAWVKENQNSRNYIGTTSGFNVWEPILVYGKAKKCVARDSFSIPIGIQPEAADHPCPKSLKAWSWLVENFTDEGDSILDVFLGSGTTLMAAEQLGRRCFALEIEPAYCDVSVKRWENLTGRKAVLETAGRKARRNGQAVKAHA